jgi:hypothetical protein
MVSFAFIGRVRLVRAAVANLRRAFANPPANSYRPEAHYMRGPGPKWRQKHAAQTTPATGRR